MKRITIPILFCLIALFGCMGGCSADRTPPGLKKGMKIPKVYYAHGGSDDTFIVEEIKGNWVYVKYEGDNPLKPRWINFDNVISYRTE